MSPWPVCAGRVLHARLAPASPREKKPGDPGLARTQRRGWLGERASRDATLVSHAIPKSLPCTGPGVPPGASGGVRAPSRCSDSPVSTLSPSPVPPPHLKGHSWCTIHPKGVAQGKVGRLFCGVCPGIGGWARAGAGKC